MPQLVEMDRHVSLFEQMEEQQVGSVFFNHAVWGSVEHLKRAFGNPEFQAKMQDYPPSAAASPHLVTKVAVPGICAD